MTSDNAAIEVGADVYYRIYDAILSISRIKDLDMSTRILSQTILQTYLVKQILADIESNKHMISQILLVRKSLSMDNCVTMYVRLSSFYLYNCNVREVYLLYVINDNLFHFRRKLMR